MTETPLNEQQKAHPDYDCGYLNDWGGGNVEWWWDYIRAEVDRANQHWQTSLEAAQAALAAMEARADAAEAEVARLKEALANLCAAYAACNGEDHPAYITARAVIGASDDRRYRTQIKRWFLEIGVSDGGIGRWVETEESVEVSGEAEAFAMRDSWLASGKLKKMPWGELRPQNPYGLFRIRQVWENISDAQ